MRHLDFGRLGGVAVLLTAAAVMAAPVAQATPTPTTASLHTRIFNDDPFSTLTTVNAYPASIIIDDLKFLGASGFANRHAWRFSNDGTNPLEFANGDHFRFCADLLITGGGECESGLQISPWWSPLVDGVFNVRTTDGEIACFNGRLPFYSFTGSHGITYAKGNTIRMEIIYDPNSNTMADPATIEYKVVYLANSYSSGRLPFDEGNPSEDPPHGLWGMLTPATAGGHLQYFVGGSPNGGNARAEWSNICFEALDTVPVQGTTWSAIKSLIN
ncbi:MAG: hypothetical protein SGI90_02485 [Candidatus Eisenbacteria bacterium]|mgnify:CR=1 FL=1|nr:hypothetical protein [Candidatus Eisenbacteria bacterium]